MDFESRGFLHTTTPTQASVPEFSVVFRFRAYSRRHETKPEGIPPQDVLRPGGRRARWLLRDGAVQRQSAVQRVADWNLGARPFLRAGWATI